MWKAVVQPGNPRLTVHGAEGMRFACQITNTRYRHTHTHNI